MNKNILNCIMGTVDSCPFAPRSKMIIDPGTATLGAGIISGGVNLLGNLLGFGSSKSANSTNLEIARMNNEQQYKMFQEQNAFNEDMWNKQNEYNLPKNVVKRLLDAGINPASVFGNGSATPAGSLQSATAPQLQRAEVRPFTPDFSGVGDAVNAYFDNQIKNKAAEGSGLDNQAKLIDNQYKAMHHIGDLLEQKHRIDKMISDTNVNNENVKYLKEQSEYLGMQINKFKDTYDLMVEREKIQNDVMRNQSASLLADATLKRVQARFQDIVLEYYPRITEQNLSLVKAQFGYITEQTQQLVREGKLTNAKTTSQYIMNQLQRLELWHERNKVDNGTGDEGIKSIRSLADYLSGLIFDNIKLFK